MVGRESRYFLLNDLRNNKHDYPMMVQRYVALAFEQNAVPKAADIPVLKPYLTVDSTQQAATLKNFEKQTAFLGERPIIGFCPGAEFGPAKRWPHYHYAKLAEMLIEKGYAVELFGSPKDVEAGEQIRNALSAELQSFCLNLAGQTNLNQAVDLIANCTAVVSNDSGLMHISAATERPLVALYGPTSPTYTPPLSDKAVIIRLIEGDLIKVRKSTDSSEGYHQKFDRYYAGNGIRKIRGIISKMNPIRIHLQLIGMVILWGASWPWGRVVAQAMPTFVASSVRFFSPLFLIIWLYAANRFKYAKQLRPNQWVGLLLTALLGIFGYSTFFIWGLKYVPAGQGTMVVASNPVFTMFFAILLFKEKWNRWVVLGMIIAISGSLLAMTKGNPTNLLQNFGFGQMLLLCALVCWVAYTLLARKVLIGIDSLTATTISSTFGFHADVGSIMDGKCGGLGNLISIKWIAMV